MSEFKLRNMKEKDIDIIYMHIHYSYVCKYFKNEKFQKKLYKEKYKELINSKNYIFHIFENKSDNFIAMVSYKLKNVSAEIRIYLNKEHRGKKYSKEILKSSVENLKEKKRELKILEAYILDENIASKKIFESLEFKCGKQKKIGELEYLVYKKRIF